MATIKELYIQSLLAQASYATLSPRRAYPLAVRRMKVAY